MTSIPRITLEQKNRVDRGNGVISCCKVNYSVNSASGPFDENCPDFLTCEDTKFGCCKDGATVANGLRFEGCPDSTCDKTL